MAAPSDGPEQVCLLKLIDSWTHAGSLRRF